MTTDIKNETPKPVGSGDWLASGLPDVKAGHCKQFLVTCEGRNGNRWVKIAQYANDHWMEWDDSYDGQEMDADGGKKWTGWLEVRQDRHGGDLIMSIEGTVVAWMPKPSAFVANTREAEDAATERTKAECLTDAEWREILSSAAHAAQD